MVDSLSISGIDFAEGGAVEAFQLNSLYKLIGWDRYGRRTLQETREMLEASRFYVAAHAADHGLVGFARVCGDPYVAQVLDVITHPDWRRRGIATESMRRVLGHLERSRYVTVTLTAGTELAAFYERFEFRIGSEATRRWSPST